MLKHARFKKAACSVGFGCYHNHGIISKGINIFVKFSVFDNV